MSIADVLAAKVPAPQPRNPTKDGGTVPAGMFVTSTEEIPQEGAMQPQLSVGNVTMSSPVRPIRTDEAQVLFKSTKVNFAFKMKDKRVEFERGYLLTTDEAVIAHVKKNFVPTLVSIEEDGGLVGSEPKKD